MRGRMIARSLFSLGSGVVFATLLGCAEELVVSEGAPGTDERPTGDAEDGADGTVNTGAFGGAAGGGGAGWADAGEPPVEPGTGGDPTATGSGTEPLQLVINGHDMVPGYDAPADPAVEQLLEQMTLEQKITQMQGVPGEQRNYNDIMRSLDSAIAGVGMLRGYRYRDGAKGVNLDAGQDNRPDDDKNYSTHFPAPSLRAASWDLDLEWRVGRAMGDETAASKNNVLLAPCVNVMRHPFWGRAQEAYGEDSHLIGRMSAAFTAGLQQHVMGCATHFAANNIEKDRAIQDAVLTEQSLRESYGRHFEMVIRDGGVGCVMAAYNQINGVKATLNAHLLTTVLREPYARGGMGFRGLVLSDWWAMPGDQTVPDAATARAVAIEAVRAGLDVELPWPLHYEQLAAAALADPSLTAFIDASARRVLEQKFRFGTAFDTDPWSQLPPTTRLEGGSIAGNEAHLELAEESAVKSAVLLTNGAPGAPVLPLTAATSIAVVGIDQYFTLVSSSLPKSCAHAGDTGQSSTNSRECTFHFATDPALGDRGSSRVNADPALSYGPFRGIQQIAGPERTVTSGNSAAAAAGADTVVVVVGYTPGDEGEEYSIAEGGDRRSLDLPPGHNELVTQVLDQNKPTVIIVESGSIVNLPWLSHPNQNQATIWAGYPGMRGGLALGKLLFGEANFSGKLPMAWPLESDLPVFKTEERRTEMDYFFGYRWYDRQIAAGEPVNLVFPFGWGLSYTTFRYSNLRLPGADATADSVLYVEVDITNTGSVDGEEVPMLFVAGPPRPAEMTGERNVKELKSFAKVVVPARATVTATLPVRVQDLRHWEGGADGRWVIDPGDYTLLVGPNASPDALTLSGVVSVHP